MTTPFYLSGSDRQQAIVRDALAVCDFPFERLLPSLLAEGRNTIRVDWEDLSRYAASDGKGHDHVHEGDAVAHPIERVVEGRRRVLGLFYLPPYTRVVLDLGLESSPRLGMEVFLAEAAHAVDYHFMDEGMRRAFVNSVHTQVLPADHSTADGVAFNLDGHTCSWFDVGEYADWVGEAFMEGFIEAFAPSIPVTISLNHPVGAEDRVVIRQALGVDAVLEPVVEPDYVGPDAEESVPSGPVVEDPVDPVPPVVEEPVVKEPRDDEHDVFAAEGGSVYHDKHQGVYADRKFSGAAEAQAAGLRPCRVCKPGR